jgi:hypothetical protein
MRKSVTVSITTAFTLYLLVSTLCYSALGDTAHPMVLTSFTVAAPWATVLGNVLVLLHMVSAYQVFCQPMFAGECAATSALKVPATAAPGSYLHCYHGLMHACSASSCYFLVPFCEGQPTKPSPRFLCLHCDAAMEAGLARRWAVLDEWVECGGKQLQLGAVRLCYRSLYVAGLTAVAVLFPFL